jgi:hypothetical protein
MQDHQTTHRVSRRFTIAEANAMLPLVRSIVADIQEICVSVTSRRSDLHRLLRKGRRTSGAQYDDEIAESRADLQEEYDKIWHYREELETLGLHLKSPQAGSIEFPTTMGGRDAFLCWQLGDSQILFWREADPERSDRHPLPPTDLPRLPSGR